MTKLTNSRRKQAASELGILTLTLAAFGFVVFYLASQAVTPEDAHLMHWGLAAVGGAAGWLIGLLVERSR